MYEVTAIAEPINFGAQGLDAIKQNLMTILTTIQGTVPLNRSFGIPITILDDPLPIAQARLSAIVLRAIRDLEPRVSVDRVTFDQDMQMGHLIPVVRFTVKEGVPL